MMSAMLQIKYHIKKKAPLKMSFAPLLICLSIAFDNVISTGITEYIARNQTNSPTLTSVSNIPTYYPTQIPTAPPTYILDKFIHIEFNISNITSNITLEMNTLSAQSSMETIIRQCYIKESMVLHPNQSSLWLQAKEFAINIISILTDETYHIEQPIEPNTFYTNLSVSLKSMIKYTNASEGDQISVISRKEKFRARCEDNIQNYFNYTSLTLAVGDPWKKVEIIKQDPTIWWVSIGIGVACNIVAVASFIYNNCVKSAWTDNGNSIAVPLYGLQMVDVLSDIYLCIEIFSQFNSNLWDWKKWKLFVAGYGNFSFFVIPYITNLILAAGIKKVKIIRNNPFAKSYFQTTSWFFIVLVVFSGGVYPALSIVSSRLFAFEFLNSGLSGMELTKLTKYRFFGTNCLENIPQFFFSLLYTNYRADFEDTLSSSAILSMTLSMLQLIAAITNFIVNRRATDCVIVTTRSGWSQMPPVEG